MKKQNAIRELENLIVDLQKFSNQTFEFDRWCRKAERKITKIFQDKSISNVDEFNEIFIEPNSILEYYENGISTFQNKQKKAFNLLSIFIDEVQEWEEILTIEELNIKEIEILIQELASIKSENFKRFDSNPEFEKWYRKSDRFLTKIFGENSKNCNIFHKISFYYNGSRGYAGLEVPIDKITFENAKISTLSFFESCIEELNESSQNTQLMTTIQSNQKNFPKKKLFIVHGHDEATKIKVARFIEQLNYSVVILHEEASSNKTIIEKIEHYVKEVGFGIVLYTDCDLGKNKADENLNPRARQNVVFEHGYLIGQLGRSNVVALIKNGVEKPSDIDGVIYISLEENWQLKLVKELEASGFEIDGDLLKKISI